VLLGWQLVVGRLYLGEWGPREIGGLCVYDVASEARVLIRGCDVGAILDETRGLYGGLR
jgi:hypothetical protein